jgi:hypothetical protein
MPLIPFDVWSANDVKTRMQAGLDPTATQVNRSFYGGDHWQNGEGWIGPLPKASQTVGEQGARETYQARNLHMEIQRGFISKNVTAEVIDRHRDGIIGTEPDWSFMVRRPLKEAEKPTTAEQSDIDTVEAAMTAWWDKHKVHETFKQSITKLLYAAGTLKTSTVSPSRTCLRLFVPAGLLDEGTIGEGETARRVRGLAVPSGDIAAALDKIFVDAPEPDQSNVWTDTEKMTMLEVGLFVTTDAISGQQTVEIDYVDANGNTIVKTFVGSGEGQTAEMRLGGRLTMHKLERSGFVTDQVRQNQKALNLEMSMVPRNATLAGFLERIIMNAEVPGHWETTADGGKKFVPDPYYSGAATINWLRGIMMDNPTGGKTLSTPQVHTHEPTVPTALIEAKRDAYRDILEETDQIHALLMADATASGESRKQARGEFAASLKETQIPLEAAGRWLLETALAMAEHFANVPGKYTNALRAVFSCRLDTGPLSDAEQTTIVAQVDKGMLSRASGMVQIGNVSDPDAEIARIMEQDGGNLDVRLKKATIYGLLITAGLPEIEAATLAGFTDEEKKVLQDMIDAAKLEAERQARLNPPPDPNAPPVPPGRTQPPVPGRTQPPAGGGGRTQPPRAPQPPRANPNGNRQPAAR